MSNVVEEMEPQGLLLVTDEKFTPLITNAIIGIPMENGFSKEFPPNFDLIDAHLKDASKQGFLIAEWDEELQTVSRTMALTINMLWWSDKVFLTNTLMWVHPERRKNHGAREMLDFAEAVADKLDIPFILDMVSSTNLNQINSIGVKRKYRKIRNGFIRYKGD